MIKKLFMHVSAKVEGYTSDQLRVDLHKFCNFIPVISTLTNLVAVVEKYLYVPDTDTELDHFDSRYYTYLKAQDFKKDWLLFIPCANTVFSILRCCSSEASELNLDHGSLEESSEEAISQSEEGIKVKLIEEEVEIVTDYRPSFSPIIPDKKGLYKPRYLLERTEDEKIVYLETLNNQRGPENTSYVRSPVLSISGSMTPNKFFALCEKQYPHYELQHGSANNGCNAFITASGRGNLALLNALIDIVKDDAIQFVNQDGGRSGITPLHYACSCKDKNLAVEMAKILIAAGADVNLLILSPVDEFSRGNTPLSLAGKYENAELVQLLLENGAKLGIDEDTQEFLKEEWFHEEIERKVGKILNRLYTPFNCSKLFEVSPEQVDFIFKIAINANIVVDNQVREKCLPFIMAKNTLSLPLNFDIITLIVKITRASMEIKFW
jgi:hypothetical protein